MLGKMEKLKEFIEKFKDNNKHILFCVNEYNLDIVSYYQVHFLKNGCEKETPFTFFIDANHMFNSITIFILKDNRKENEINIPLKDKTVDDLVDVISKVFIAIRAQLYDYFDNIIIKLKDHYLDSYDIKNIMAKSGRIFIKGKNNIVCIDTAFPNQNIDTILRLYRHQYTTVKIYRLGCIQSVETFEIADGDSIQNKKKIIKSIDLFL